MESRPRFFDDFFIFAAPTSWFFLFLPIELYYRNKDEWGVPVGEFFAFGLCLVLSVALLLACISRSLSIRRRVLFIAIVYSIFAIAFVHTFLPMATEERELNGILLDFSFPSWVHLLSLAVIGAVSITIYTLRQRLFSHASSNYLWISVLIFLASLGLVWASHSQSKETAYRTAGTLSAQQLQEVYSFSSQRNLLLLILDCVPADVALEVIEAHESIARAVKDFLFFKNNLSIAPQTYMSMANLHIGAFWSESFDEHQQSAPRKVRDQSFFNLLTEAGWKLSLIGRGPCPAKLDICGSTDTRNLGAGGQLHFSEPFIQALNIILLKTSPIFLKKWVYNDEDFLIKGVDVFRFDAPGSRATSSPQIPRFDSEAQRDNYFLTWLADHGSVSDATPRVKMFHLMSAHPRFYLDAACQKGQQEYSREAMKRHVACQFEAIVHLVNRLKEKGIYDTTSIILAADHGIDFPSGFVDATQAHDSIPHFLQMVTQANALLMFKQERADLPRMMVSELPTSTVDIVQTVCEIAALDCQGRFTNTRSLLRLEEWGKDRVRLYAHHGFGAENAKLHGMDLYAVKGTLWDAKNWQYLAHLPEAGAGSGEAARAALRAAMDGMLADQTH
jgi:hypothetical protein